MAILTDKTLFPATLSDDDVIHVVDVDVAAPGTSYKLKLSQLKTYVGVASFDKVAVFAASGTPTFYNTFALAYAAVPVDGSIHVFADLTEDITIDKSITVVAYGNTITGEFFITSGAFVTMDVLNLTLADAVNPTLAVDSNSTAILNNSTVTNTLGVTIQTLGTVENGISYGEVDVNATGILRGHKSFNSGTEPAILSSGTLSRCYGENIGGSAVPSLNIGIKSINGFVDFCEGISEFGNAIQIEGNTLITNSTAKSQSLFYGLYQVPAATGSIKHCTGYTAGSDGISGNRIYNCVGESESTAGISSAEECSESTGIGGGVSGLQAKGGGTVKFLNCTAIGKLSKGVSIDTGTHGVFIGCKIISQADELFGHAVHLSTATAIFTGNGCYFETVNASAEGFESTAASTVVNVSDSSFNIASGVRFASNVDQSEVNLANNLGNRNIL